MGNRAQENSVLLLKWLCVLFGVALLLYSVTVLLSITLLSSFESQSTKDIEIQGKSKQESIVLRYIDYGARSKDISGKNNREVKGNFDQDSESQMDYVPANRRVLNPAEESLNGIDKLRPLLKAAPDKEENLKIDNKNMKDNDEKVNNVEDSIVIKEKPFNIVNNDEKIDYRENKDLDYVIANAPKTFNEEYVRYFWKHPELYQRYENLRNALINKDNLKVNDKSKVEIQGDVKVDDVKTSVKEETNVETGINSNSERKAYMRVASPRGQLGNQMFQLATLIGISSEMNFKPILPTKDFMTNMVFETNFQSYENIETSKFVTFTDENETIPATYKMMHKLDNHTNWSLDGYFQSWVYFASKQEEVRSFFQIKDVYLWEAQEFIGKNVPQHTVKVAIHIRRQDFISSYQTKLGRVPATAEYVRNAQKYFEEKYVNVIFIVVSDDMNWCRKNINGTNVIYSHSNAMGTDLAILSECNHVIISVGTFGWWGGWLSGGTVIYYKNYPTPGSYIDSTFDAPLYYPSEWIPME